MKYSTPNLHGLGGPGGLCTNGSSATTTPDAGTECATGDGAGGYCSTGTAAALNIGCVSGPGNLAYCSMGGSPGDPSNCVGGFTFTFGGGSRCSSGSAPDL